MKILIKNISLKPGQPEDDIKIILSKKYAIHEDFEYEIIRRSLDARKKSAIAFRYQVAVDVPDDAGMRLLKNPDASEYNVREYPVPAYRIKNLKAVIVGTGPAGLFCGLRLIDHGAEVVFIERGKTVEERIHDITKLEQKGVLNPESNVLFGEGGAGAYSDGKLTTRTRRPETDWFFKKMVEFDADSSILYDAKPHIGTDKLTGIIINIRNSISGKGGTFHFNETVKDLIIENRELIGVKTAKKEYAGDAFIFATGHSARDIYELCDKKGIMLEKKGFAAGVRVEHPAELVNRIQYGNAAGKLPAADYRIAYNNPVTGMGVYSFCMCPGGRVVNSSSESGMLCTNGMSYSARDLAFSNAALVATVTAHSLAGGPLAGIRLQREIEEKAYASGGGGFFAPAQRIDSFLNDRIDRSLPESSYLPGIFPAMIRGYLPSWITEELKTALRFFNSKMKGFISDKGVLIGAETRTSSPVRICRGDHFESLSIKRLYPVGEGSGYAGGIVSSAVDGIRAADCIAARYAE